MSSNSLTLNFKCELCVGRNSFQTGNYQDWLAHLTSLVHQQEAKKKLVLRRQWEGEEGTYVLTGMCLANEQIPWTNMELAQWLTTFGLVMEYFHDPVYHYVAFTLKDLALGVGKAHDVARMRKFKGHDILIKLKSEYKYDWGQFFGIVDNRIQRDFEERKQKWENRELERRKTSVEMKSVRKSDAEPVAENISKCLPATGCSPSTSTPARRNDMLTSTHVTTKVAYENPTSHNNTTNPPNEMEERRSNIRRRYSNVNSESLMRRTGKVSPSSSNKSVLGSEKAAEAVAGPSGSQPSSTPIPESKDLGTEKKKKKKKSKRKSKVTQSQVPNGVPLPSYHNDAPMKEQHLQSQVHNSSSQFTPREIKTEVYIARSTVGQPIVGSTSSNQVHVPKIPSSSSNLAACEIREQPTAQSTVGANVRDAPETETLNFRGGFGSGIGRSRPASESSDLSGSQGVNKQKPVPVPLLAAPLPNPAPFLSRRACHENRNYVRGQSLEFRRSQLPHSSPSYRGPLRQQPQSSHAHAPVPLMNQGPHPKNFGQRYPPNQNNAIPPDLKKHELKRMGSGSSIEDQRSRRRPEKQHTEVDFNRARNSQGGNYSRMVNEKSDHDNFQHRPFCSGVSDNRNVISPVLIKQIPPKISTLLAHPLLESRSHTQPRGDPYPLNQGTASPNFELFQHMVSDEPHLKKPQSDKMGQAFIRLDLTQQLLEFFVARTLTEDELRLRWQLILDISLILRQKYPTCELHPFGSILTGLGDSKSDIDIYVDLSGESVSNRSVDSNGKASSVKLLNLTKDALNRIGCPHNNNRRFLSSLVSVTSAKVPILKLQHATTGINCDLSFENRLSVQNTKLIRFYMNLDVKISRFMVLIRFWAKVHGLTGSNFIKNYALTLLVLVYLCKKSLVPQVHLLQIMKAEEREYINLPSNPNEIDGWDASFCANITRIQQRFTPLPFPGTNSSPPPSEAIVLMKMAAEFFQTYATLDFSTIVVCPLLGEFLPRSKFTPGFENLPKSLGRYTSWAIGQPLARRLNINAFLCLQDPFLLSYNVGSVTPQATLLKFQIACAKTAQILEQTGELNSLLDVFACLPNHIGNKRFMRVYKTERKTEALKEEIKAAILEKYFMDGKIEHESSSPASTSQKKLQKSDYVALPPHLSSLGPFMDERSLKAADKKGKWETVIDFSLGSQFESIFVTELTLCRIQNDKRIAVVGSLCELWREFTLDFMLDFFAKGLKLEILKKRDVAKEESLDMTRKKYEDENQSRWNMMSFSQKQVESLDASPRTKFQVDLLCKKIWDLPQIHTPVHYEKLRVQVDHPFWENRSATVATVLKEMPETEIINIPVLNQKEKKKDKRRSRTNEKGPQLDREETRNLKSYLPCFNPVTVQGRVSDKLKLQHQQKIEKEGKLFSSFWIDMLVKLDLSATRSRPQLFILFEMDEAAKHSKNDFVRATQALYNILDEHLPTYLTFRLVKWLNLKHIPLPLSVTTATSKQVPDRPPSNSGEAVNKSPGGGEESVNEESRIPGGKKKMKMPTKSESEEYLLIPSSCDSSNSTEEDEGWEMTDQEDLTNGEGGKVKEWNGHVDDAEDNAKEAEHFEERKEVEFNEQEELNMAGNTEEKTKEKQEEEKGDEELGRTVEGTEGEGNSQEYEVDLGKDKEEKERAEEEHLQEVLDPEEKESAGVEEEPKKEVRAPKEKESADEKPQQEFLNPEEQKERAEEEPQQELLDPEEKGRAAEEPKIEVGALEEKEKEPEEDLEKEEKAKLVETEEKAKEQEEDLDKDKGEKTLLEKEEKSGELEEKLDKDKGEKALLLEKEEKAKEPEEEIEKDKGTMIVKEETQCVEKEEKGKAPEEVESDQTQTVTTQRHAQNSEEVEKE